MVSKVRESTSTIAESLKAHENIGSDQNNTASEFLSQDVAEKLVKGKNDDDSLLKGQKLSGKKKNKS